VNLYTQSRYALVVILMTAGVAFPAAIGTHRLPAWLQAGATASHDNLNHRGDTGMGFSQTATTHHFFLTSDGGIIQVTANDSKDNASIQSIRTHLGHIAKAFASGDFDIPMFVHDQVPPGVPEMKQWKSKIRYRFESVDAGGRVRIRTREPKAVEALHAFLRFQIVEHKTGDPESVSAR
jgi:hypothetical protein